MRIRGLQSNQKVFQQIREIPERFQRGIEDANKIIGKVVAKEAKRTIREDPKTGRIMTLRDIWTGELVSHQASAPGESPAKFSNSLATSIDYLPRADELVIGAGSATNDVPTVRVTSIPGQIGFGRIVDYAYSLEVLQGRPYLKPSIKKYESVTEGYYERVVGKRLLR